MEGVCRGIRERLSYSLVTDLKACSHEWVKVQYKEESLTSMNFTLIEARIKPRPCGVHI